MKHSIIIFITAIAITTSCIKASSDSACEQNFNVSNCIDPSQIDSIGICTMDYTPVCGCDKVTYSNSCFAEKNGIQSWVEGECCE